MKKVLFVATVVKTHIREFHIPALKMFKEKGWETAVAARNDYEIPEDCIIPYCDAYYDIPFERFPLKPGNIQAYKQLKKIIDEEHYDIIHCHTPVGAMLARLAGRKARKNGSRVIYTAHGFHFYKGAPLLNWLVYFPVEWLCSFMTDTLITINQEDYNFAQKHMHAKQIEYVPGVGIDLPKIEQQQADVQNKRAELQIPPDKVWILTVGEMTKNKNHKSLIEAISEIPDLYLTIAGRGTEQQALLEQIDRLNLADRVKLLGYRSDVFELCKAADVFAFPSYREGLPVALMEAMACGKPIVCSAIRGNTDLIDSEGGELFDPHSVETIRNALEQVQKRDWGKMGAYNAQKIKTCGLSSVMSQLMKIYNV